MSCYSHVRMLLTLKTKLQQLIHGIRFLKSSFWWGLKKIRQGEDIRGPEKENQQTFHSIGTTFFLKKNLL